MTRQRHCLPPPPPPVRQPAVQVPPPVAQMKPISGAVKGVAPPPPSPPARAPTVHVPPPVAQMKPLSGMGAVAPPTRYGVVPPQSRSDPAKARFASPGPVVTAKGTAGFGSVPIPPGDRHALASGLRASGFAQARATAVQLMKKSKASDVEEKVDNTALKTALSEFPLDFEVSVAKAKGVQLRRDIATFLGITDKGHSAHGSNFAGNQSVKGTIDNLLYPLRNIELAMKRLVARAQEAWPDYSYG